MMQIRDYLFDKKLHIHTVGIQPVSEATAYYHRYEASPYVALEQLFTHYRLKKTDRLIDFGCGKGRLNIYTYDRFKNDGVGIEMNEKYYQQAIHNLLSYSKKDENILNRITFMHSLAETYEMTEKDNYFYFFNPFSVEIFRKVINNLLYSLEQHMREVKIILYYPDDEYVHYLEQLDIFQLEMEILLPENKKDPYEKFLVYSLKSKM